MIGANRFLGDSVAIQLWANPLEPSDWQYPKRRDTRSRGHHIDANVFYDNRVGVERTGGLRVY